MALANLYLRAGQEADAVPQLIAASRLSTGDPTPHQTLANIYRQFNYLDRELDSLRSLLLIDRSNWRAELRMSRIYQDLQWFVEARAPLDRAMKLAPTEPEVYLARATFEFLTRKPLEMIRIADDAIKRWPRDARFYALKAEGHRLEPRYPQAESHLRLAIEYASTDSEKGRHLAALAHLLLEKEWNPPRYSEAEQAAREAVAHLPEDVEGHYWLARSLDLQGKPDAALREYEAVAKRDIRYEATPLHLGRIYARSSDPKKRKEGERLVKLYPKLEDSSRRFVQANERVRTHPYDPTSHAEMGQWYLRIGQPALAVVELRRVLMMSPRDAASRKLLAKALRVCGRETEAMDFENG